MRSCQQGVSSTRPAQAKPKPSDRVERMAPQVRARNCRRHGAGSSLLRLLSLGDFFSFKDARPQFGGFGELGLPGRLLQQAWKFDDLGFLAIWILFVAAAAIAFMRQELGVGF